jgi:16S rRNA processing protein RimM
LSSSDASRLVRIGRVGRPHGLDGSFVVEDASEAPERFAIGATVLAGGVPARVAAAKRAGGRLVVKLDREVARGLDLEIARAELPPLEEDAYYVADLVGLEVEEEGGRSLGHVADVASGVANDILELDSGQILPLVEACVRRVDLAAGLIVVAPGFADPE